MRTAFGLVWSRMESQEVGGLLQDCLDAVVKQNQQQQATEEQRQSYYSCRDGLCVELASLLQEAEQMKWPFVPEKWQYKESVEAQDKTNLSDLIRKHLPQLLSLLKASIVAQESCSALAVLFLVDRFLYWSDESVRLLKITKLLHRLFPEAPVAPQLVIRQARLYLNSGKLQKAEYILSRLINNSGTTGCWVYQCPSDRALVQAVSVQVRGMVLQKLGLWLEAAELIWASLVGYYALPQPDKKGIGTSLGLLANILASMNNEDFSAFKANPDIDLSLLGERSHPLLSAAQAAKMAVVYSQYTSLYVLTNVVAQGTCLLSYSYSLHCPTSQRHSYLLQAREAFQIGLLTKSEGEAVTSVQELHTFLKAAYSLSVTHKWLGSDSALINQATQHCQEALGIFYNYCKAEIQDKDGLCADIMRLISKVKVLLQVEPFYNSDKGSFIPDSYRKIKETPVNFNLEGFSKMLQKFKMFHATLCETERSCKGASGETEGAKSCITALATTIGTLNTECTTEAKQQLPQTNKSASSSSHNLGSSWQNFSLSISPRPSSGSVAAAVSDQSLMTTETDEVHPEKGNLPVTNSAKSPTTSSSNSSAHSWKFEMIQAAIETLDTENDNAGTVPSLGDSFGSNSSWVKLSASLNSPTNGKKVSLSRVGSSKSSDSSESFFLLETVDSESSDSMLASNKQGNASSRNDFVSPKPKLAQSDQCGSTETSTGSSFEMVEQSKNIPGDQENGKKEVKNAHCHSCVNGSFAGDGASERLYVLTEQDYNALLAGVCHQCLLQRLNSETIKFQLKKHRAAYSALHLKFSKATGLWTARETCVYIGEPMGLQGKQRKALWVQFLHQEERLSSYVGKDYLKPKELQFHLKDVERQMTAQYYVTEFNKSLYDRDVMAQIFFIPSEALLILEGNEIEGCVTVEPFMLGDFVKLTNNTVKKDQRFQATEYGLAFGHFTYMFSDGQEVVVDLQGWVTANGKGLTYLTDPQIHSSRLPKGPSNFAERGLRYFVEEQHGPECNGICRLLQLPPVKRQSPVIPHLLS